MILTAWLFFQFVLMMMMLLLMDCVVLRVLSLWVRRRRPAALSRRPHAPVVLFACRWELLDRVLAA